MNDLDQIKKDNVTRRMVYTALRLSPDVLNVIDALVAEVEQLRADLLTLPERCKAWQREGMVAAGNRVAEEFCPYAADPAREWWQRGYAYTCELSQARIVKDERDQLRAQLALPLFPGYESQELIVGQEYLTVMEYRGKWAPGAHYRSDGRPAVLLGFRFRVVGRDDPVSVPGGDNWGRNNSERYICLIVNNLLDILP